MRAPGQGSTHRRRRVFLGATVVAALAGVPAAGALSPTGTAAGTAPTGCRVATGTWPEYQGEPTHSADACSGLNPADAATLRPAWFVGTNGPVTDTPAVNWGRVFAGDYSGRVYSIDQSSGRTGWTFDTTAATGCFLDAPSPHADTHSTGFGQIPASPATATIDGRNLVFVGAGGSLFALDAASGKCVWAQDTDPGRPGNSLEVESSPVVDPSTPTPEVLIGNDDNSSAGVGVTGLMAFDAGTGALLWKYEPERDLTLTPGEFGGSDAATLSCGDGSPNPDCDPTRIADLAPNQTAFADACGDVWSSPALDSSFTDPGGVNSFQGSGAGAPAGWAPKQVTTSGQASPDGLVVFGTGNCSADPNPSAALAHGDYVDEQGIFALDPVTGVRVWNFVEPYNTYDNNPNEPWAGDDDFGSSALLAHVPADGIPPNVCPPDGGPKGGRTTTLVIEGSKAGYAFGICEATGPQHGRPVWSNQVAQPGQLSPDSVGAVGGMIGSPSLGLSNGRPTVFFTSAIPLPFSNDGFRQPGDGDSNIASCPGLSQLPLLPACPDLSILNDPQRITSLHAVDAATGKVDYQVPTPPTFAASSYTNGVVFMPDSLAGGVAAFDADQGTPLWAFPLGSFPASAAAIAGNSIFLGSGESEGAAQGQSLPPQLFGIWSFSTDPAGFNFTPPPA